MKKKNILLFLNLSVIAFCACFLVWADRHAQEKRNVPSPSGVPRIVTVATQRDAYDVYKDLGFRGIKVIHLNRFLNLMEYLPPEEQRSVPFPIRTFDIRPAYENGLNSHNWLFIANRTGLVRAVAAALPDEILDLRLNLFISDHAFTVSGRRIKGYAQDMPFTVSTLAELPVTREPVVVNVDAGFFLPGVDPVTVYALLREKCADVRVVTLIVSLDEEEVTPAMRASLKRFEALMPAHDEKAGDIP